MTKNDQPSLLTRPSLLFRLRDWGDNASWDEFYRLYRRFIRGLALRAGLNHAEADEVVQDVLRNVATRIKDYEVRENRGAFRRWLMNQTRWRIADEPDNDFWELEWQKHVLETAMERLARRVPPKHFQAFDLYARHNQPAGQIAKNLGMSRATVYLITHRLKKQLRHEVTSLREYHA
jgi:RNA polymerase sigma-70 factor (ECF subfamily)